jgi:hypothetical protein
MIHCVLQGIMRSRNFIWHILLVFQGIVLESFKVSLFFWGETCLLLLPDLLCGDFREFIRTSFPDEDSHFIVGWLAAILLCEFINGPIPLYTALTVSFLQIIRDPANLKA